GALRRGTDHSRPAPEQAAEGPLREALRRPSGLPHPGLHQSLLLPAQCQEVGFVRVSNTIPLRTCVGANVSGSKGNRAWRRGGASAARRGGWPAASKPAGYPLFSRPIRGRVLPLCFCPEPLQQQETVCQHHHAAVMVEAAPAAALEVVQAQLLLHLLVALLHRPAALPEANRLPYA